MDKDERLLITRENMLLVPSKSRFEMELEEHGGEDLARKRYRAAWRWDHIRESHFAQKENLKRVVQVLGPDRIFDRSLLTEENISRYDLFVFLGGDNHFTYCADLILDYMRKNPCSRKYVAGVVLDPSKSVGALLDFDTDSFLMSLPHMGNEGLLVERWTTLESVVDCGVGIAHPLPAVADYFVGEYSSLFMSRSDVFGEEAYIDGKQILPEKSSGILVVTGSGSGRGSWYDHIYQCYFGRPDGFGRQEDFARVIARENGSKSVVDLPKGKTLLLDSYNDNRGIVAPDSNEEHLAPFEMGSQAKIWVSDLKLLVAKPLSRQ